MDIGKMLLLGGAAYLAYEYFYAPGSTATSTAPGGILPANAPIPAPTPTTNPLTTQQMVLAEATRSGFTQGSADQWNTFYKTVRAIDAPDPGSYLTAENRGEVLTFPEWWGLASAHGLSGYRRAS